MIHRLRLKLAKKELEAGRLYLRTEKYNSALIYFNLILTDYYDTTYFDEALLNIILTYILKNEFENAQLFLAENRDNFISQDKYDE